jgi:uncharacterized membrane protein
MGALYIAAGIYHFINPKLYLRIMPPYIPWHKELIFLSGVAEVVVGVGLFFDVTRSIAAWGTILLLIAIYPANIYMYTSKVKIGKTDIPLWGHILRFFAQLGLIFWAYTYT